MSDIVASETPCDENSAISCECSTTRESASAGAVVEQSAINEAEPHVEILSSASAPPLPITEATPVETLDDAGNLSTVASSPALTVIATEADAETVIIQSPEVAQEIAALVTEEPQILEEVKVIDQLLEELPEELRDLSLDEIVSKAPTPLPEVQKVASKLTTSYAQYKAYLNYIQNGSEEQKKVGEPITVIKKKVPGVNCGEEPQIQPKIIHQVPVAQATFAKPTFYQFLKPAFCKPACMPTPCCPTLYPSYPSNLLLKSNCYPSLNISSGFSYPYTNAFRGSLGLNQANLNTSLNAKPQSFAKSFAKPNYMGGFYGF